MIRVRKRGGQFRYAYHFHDEYYIDMTRRLQTIFLSLHNFKGGQQIGHQFGVGDLYTYSRRGNGWRGVNSGIYYEKMGMKH